MRSRAIGIGWVLLLSLGLAACPPVTSKNPIGTTAKATPDPALAGEWKGRFASNDTASYFTILPQEDGTDSVVITTPPTAKDAGGWGAFSVQTVTLGANHFMNARQTFDDGKPATGNMADNTTPLLYRLNGDGALVLYIIDENAARAAIKSGKLAGTIEPGQYGDVTITADPVAFDAYMSSPDGRALFVKPLTILRRVK